VRRLANLLDKFLEWSFQRQADKMFLKSQGENYANGRKEKI
jgi:hypothetical protein